MKKEIIGLNFHWYWQRTPLSQTSNEPRHDKTNTMSVRPAKTQISLGIRPVWSESSLCAQWVAKDPSFLHADSEDSDQTGRIPRLIWVFAGRTLILLVLSCRGSNSLFLFLFATFYWLIERNYVPIIENSYVLPVIGIIKPISALCIYVKIAQIKRFLLASNI